MLANLCSAAAMAAALSTGETHAYGRDVEFIVQRILTVHPGPFAHADRATLLKDAAAIKASAPRRGLGCATAQLMALTAELHDGHTYVLPINIPGEMGWFPIRFYAFPDGLYVTSVAPEYAELAGKRVLSIGKIDANTALQKAMAIQAANNALAAREGTVWLSQAAIATALGAASDGGMEVTVSGSDGSTMSRTLVPFKAELNDSWNQQGEMFGPRRLKDAQPYVTAFDGRGPLDFRKSDPALPPHLRYRLPYYFIDIPQHKAVYFQWNFIQDYGSEIFSTFVSRMFADLDSHPTWKLIIDVRYDSGGDGSKDPNVIKQIIKRDRFDRPGSLFVITGRKTFSAAVDLVALAKQWTSAIFVGEPTGAGPNAYGDAQEMTAPNLKIPFQVSTNYHMYAKSADTSDSYAPDIPAIMTAADYFSGRDPALDAILNGTETELLPLPELGVADGGDAAKKAYELRSARWGAIPWWRPFSEGDMNEAGYKALAKGKPSDAIVLFQMNADRFPQSWNTWDSLGDAQRAAGDFAGAKASYQKSLNISPDERDPRDALDEIAKTGH